LIELTTIKRDFYKAVNVVIISIVNIISFGQYRGTTILNTQKYS